MTSCISHTAVLPVASYELFSEFGFSSQYSMRGQGQVKVQREVKPSVYITVYLSSPPQRHTQGY